MDLSYVIKRPLLSEKGTYASNELNRYTFEVDLRADKDTIKAAVEAMYNVKVAAVNTMIRKERDRMLKYGKVDGKISKKATVKLADGQKIELF